jgi:asparagine synthase (glutamine-hydrolysing)
MCGICGILALKGQTVDPEILQRMTATLRHRGPDDMGCEVIGPCGLGNTRLAVIDLSPAAHQPMHITYRPSTLWEGSPSFEAWIAYNGEAYNFREVRAALSAHRHNFFSVSDTETILRAYIQYGRESFLKPFRGMFALAIWDVAREELTLARDRLGQKPLYYYQDGEWFIFASEIKALLEHPAVPRRLNEAMIPHYLAYGYAPTPSTLFEGIHSLPPAHMLTLKPGGQPVILPYWQAPFPASGDDPREEDNIAADLLAHLRWAVRLRLVSDVPLGAFLSGGVDSAAVVALMVQESSQPVKTFAIGFEGEPSFNELSHARRVAAWFVTDHHEFVVRPNALELVEELVWYHDQPFGDSSAIPTYLVSQLTREHVTVALTGDGGDELFAGYVRFRAAQLAAYYARLPEAAHQAIGSTLERLPQSTAYAGLVRNVNRFVRSARLPLADRYLDWIRYVPGEWVEALVGKAGEASVQEHYRGYFEKPDEEIITQLLDVNIRTYLLDDLLVKVDRASMAVALEARSPFLDHRLVEFAAQIPTSLKLHRNISKYILKRALQSILPKSVLERKKHGFGVPVGRWFREEMAEFVQGTLLGPRALSRGIFDTEAVQGIIQSHLSGQLDLGHALWTLLTFELWMQRYFD